MTHLLCIFVTLIVGIVILALLWWVLTMAMGLLPGFPSGPPPKVVLAVKVLMALILVIFIIYWLLSGMPCLFPFRG